MKKYLFLIVSLLACIVALSGCEEKVLPEEKDGFVEITYTATDCYSDLKTEHIFVEMNGRIVKSRFLSDDVYLIETNYPDENTRIEMYPCQLPEECRIDNLEIKFSGKMKYHNPLSEIVATPIDLSKIKIKDYH
ncbi:hypothetical protein [Dysgonomonas sp. 520]|uniref:hypothetical protein n=1 Tax=Dysgonomonas sp. 520 TaxID=2302931 RepID=UPI0013D1ABF7|nr:hypothetical protein [Dysgonomonas sp. 520]NDW09346.1 hypothetical protein [Dysgonomonas sp. 520]